MMIGEIIFAILPSLCVSVIMLFFNRRQAKREREEKTRAAQKRTGDKTQPVSYTHLDVYKRQGK